MNTNRILQVQNITKIYGKGVNQTTALSGISFDVLEGEFLDWKRVMPTNNPIKVAVNRSRLMAKLWYGLGENYGLLMEKKGEHCCLL